MPCLLLVLWLKKYPCGLHPLAYIAAISLAGLTAIPPCFMFELAMGKGFYLNTATAVTIGRLD